MTLSFISNGFVFANNFGTTSTTKMQSVQQYEQKFLREINAYYIDYQGKITSTKVRLIKDMYDGHLFISTSGPVGGRYAGWIVYENAEYRKTSQWYGRYTHYAKVSGIDYYFSL